LPESPTQGFKSLLLHGYPLRIRPNNADAPNSFQFRRDFSKDGNKLRMH
jgi:hypothetical protein